MKERVYIGIVHQGRGARPLEICTCGGELQLRLSGAEKFGPGGWYNEGTFVRVMLEPWDLRRLADFFAEVAEQQEQEEES